MVQGPGQLMFACSPRSGGPLSLAPVDHSPALSEPAEFAGQKKTGTADAQGKWLVKLDPVPASAEGRDLVFESNLNEGKSKVSDVVVDAKGKWKLVSPATAAECSAVAYYFARDLHRKVSVPIGLVVSSGGGKRIETWMRPQALVAIGEASSRLQIIDAAASIICLGDPDV